MALKFKCEKCGEYIIVKYLRVGEIAKCPHCGAMTTVPEGATEIETDEEPKYFIPKPAEPQPERDKKAIGKVRSFWKVLVLSIVTLSIYYWVYLFKTLWEMKKAFTFDAGETNPDKVRHILIAYLIVRIYTEVVFVVTGMGTRILAQMPLTIEQYVFLMIIKAIQVAFFVAFFSSFVNLIELCQKKKGIIPLDQFIFWVYIAISVVLSFAFFRVMSKTYFDLLAIAGMIVSYILLYLIVKQVNRIWQESHGS